MSGQMLSPDKKSPPALVGISYLTEDVLLFPCVKFLSTPLARKMSPEAVSDEAKGLRQSSLRQYKSCWKAFQACLWTQKVSVIIQDSF